MKESGNDGDNGCRDLRPLSNHVNQLIGFPLEFDLIIDLNTHKYQS